MMKSSNRDGSILIDEMGNESRSSSSITRIRSYTRQRKSTKQSRVNMLGSVSYDDQQQLHQEKFPSSTSVTSPKSINFALDQERSATAPAAISDSSLDNPRERTIPEQKTYSKAKRRMVLSGIVVTASILVALVFVLTSDSSHQSNMRSTNDDSATLSQPSPTIKPTTMFHPSSEAPTLKQSPAPTRQPASSTAEDTSDINMPTKPKTDFNPSAQPSLSPSLLPSDLPTWIPTNVPSTLPTIQPSETPSLSPSSLPSKEPTASPTDLPTGGPTFSPTFGPTIHPSMEPTTTTAPTQPLSCSTSVSEEECLLHSYNSFSCTVANSFLTCAISACQTITTWQQNWQLYLIDGNGNQFRLQAPSNAEEVVVWEHYIAVHGTWAILEWHSTKPTATALVFGVPISNMENPKQISVWLVSFDEEEEEQGRLPAQGVLTFTGAEDVCS